MKTNIIKKYFIKAKRGFTLIELLVAIALFSIIISVAIGGFVRALRTQRQVISLIAANSNASLAIEQIAREMRTGVGFTCAGGSPCGELRFTNAQGSSITYRMRNEVLERGVGGSFQPVTAENVRVSHLSFTLFNRPGFPPRITMLLGVSGNTAGIRDSVTNIQTTISARRI